MFQGKIKVLLFEDNPGDVLLIKEMFKEEGASRFELASAARLVDGIKRLSEQKFDAVLLDLNLPDSSGIDTARRLKQNAPDLPIVILTALADESVALDALRIGMEDYLVKGQITGALLEHSLRYAIERKRVEEALRESELKYRLLVEQSLLGILILQDAHIVYMNNFMVEKSGYSVDEAKSLSTEQLRGLIHPDDYDAVWGRMFSRLRGNPELARNEYRFVARDGSMYWADVHTSLIEYLGRPAIQMFIADSTERKRAEEALRESEEKYRGIFDESIATVYVFDAKKNFINANQAGLDLLGYSREELLHMSIPDVDADPIVVLPAHQELLSGERLINYEHKLRRKNGTIVSVLNNSRPLTDAHGNVVGMLSTLIDITERKRAEEALRESEEKLRVLFENVGVGITVTDVTGKILDVNDESLKLYGFSSKEEVSGINGLELISKKDRDWAVQALANTVATGTGLSTEITLLRKDGSEYSGEIKTTVLHDSSGNPVRIVVVQHDITERKKAEEALRESEEKFRSLVENASEIIFSLDIEGRITYISPSIEASIGYKPAEIIGKYFKELVVPEDLKYIASRFRSTLGGKHGHAEFRVRAKSGDVRIIQTSSSMIKQNGKVIGLTGVGADITERNKAEEEIRRHVKRIEALYAIAQVISQSSTIDAMLGEALDKVCDVMDTEAGGIFMLDYDDRALKLKACKGLSESMALKVSTIMLTEQGIERLMNLTEPITGIDEMQDVVDAGKIREVVTELGNKAIIVPPFFMGKELQGVIVVFTTQERTFSRDDLELLKVISNEVSIGINNMMLLEKIREMSVTDELTGLYNRRHFFEMLDVEMNRAARTNRPFSLVMLDLDGFKEYNDKFGHINGDAALQSFSQMLKASIRKSDLAFRYGGDEFALILPTANAARAKKIMQRARSIWRKSPTTQSLVVGGHVDFSTGIAEYPVNAESSDGLVFLADAALYQAKRKGGHDDKLVSELSTLSTGILDVATQDQVYALAATVDARDPYTYGHSQRVAEIAKLIGRAIGMADENLARLHAAALLHDIGKVGVPDAILTKMGKPTKEEWRVIRRHSAEGARIVSYVKELAPIVPIILHHHECYDGTGYPDGLKGIDIPAAARITSIADAYDTMVTKRPYRNVVSHKEACEELRRYAGTQFDPALVEVWCKLVEEAEKK
jgi:diguanylate cyclase (GGDEF)-like protein/PAS domain S-box-containing protein/putative nucleotidyltransferase with HDIG domain